MKGLMMTVHDLRIDVASLVDERIWLEALRRQMYQQLMAGHDPSSFISTYGMWHHIVLMAGTGQTP